MKQFWMVHGLGKGAPTQRHATRDEARAEAHRLAKGHPGTTFVTLAAEDGYMTSNEVVPVSIEVAQEAPKPAAAPSVARPAFEVGQRWKTRGGDTARVLLVGTSEAGNLPVTVIFETLKNKPLGHYTLEGRYWPPAAGRKDDETDLVELIEDARGKPEADADDWIRWDGGARPLPIGRLATVRFSDGTEFERADPSRLYWDAKTNITAYNVVL